MEIVNQNPMKADRFFLIPPHGVELLHLRGRGLEFSQAGQVMGYSNKRLRHLSMEIKRGIGEPTELGVLLKLMELGGMDLDFLRKGFNLSSFSDFPQSVRRVLDELISPQLKDTSNKGIAHRLGSSPKHVRNLLGQTYSLDEEFNRIRAAVLYFIYSKCSNGNNIAHGYKDSGLKIGLNSPYLLYMEADSNPFLTIIRRELVLT